MALNTSPPLTSGVVVLSGSDFFSPTSSDFPSVLRLVLTTTPQSPSSSTPLILGHSPQTTSNVISSTAVGGLVTHPQRVSINNVSFPARVMRVGNDIRIRSTPVTTSGVVILDMFTNAGEEAEVFVPPVVINARIYPLYQGPIPSPAAGRIFPLLPQYSTLTPGD